MELGLSLWGIAVIISLEKQAFGWYMALQSMRERGCGVVKLMQVELGAATVQVLSILTMALGSVGGGL